MKIILATPIYPPEIGGPAIYAQKLKEGLEKKGNLIKVVSYQGLKKYPQPLRTFLYFLRLLKEARGCDLIYTFNLVSCGLPASFCFRKFAIRIGGDYLWERAVESGRSQKPLKEYYSEPKNLKERYWTFLIKKVLNGADKIIFTGNFQKEIYLKYFGIEEKKTAIIENPFPRPNSALLKKERDWAGKPPTDYQILYAGRLIKLKNLDFLIKVFKKIHRNRKDLTLKIIGSGPEGEKIKTEDGIVLEKPLFHQELMREIQKSYLCVLPSLSEITPNFALECISLAKPIILTKETGYYEKFKDNVIFFDPRSEKDLEEKIIHLLDEENYLNYIEKIKKIPTDWSWDDIIEKHTLIFNEFKKS